MIDKNTFNEILSRYPECVSNLWSEVVSILANSLGDDVAVLTFGSVCTGDFVWVVHNSQTLLASDFEFSLIASPEKISSVRRIARQVILAYNDKHANKHIGFNANIKVTDSSSFAQRLDRHPFLRNRIIQSGFFVCGQNLLAKNIPTMDTISVRPEQIREFQLNIWIELLAELDPRFVTCTSLYSGYAAVTLCRAITKIAQGITAENQQTLPTIIGNVNILRSNGLVLEAEAVTRALTLLNNHMLPKEFPRSLVDDFIFLAKGFVGDMALHPIINGQKNQDIKQLNSQIRKILLGYTTGQLGSKMQKDRVRYVLSWLDSKSEHYDYMKGIYK